MHSIIIPPYLKPNDTVGIVSTARAISETELLFAVDTLKSWNLNVQLGSTIGKKHHQFAGTDKERAKDFNNMIANDKIKAIICARGGYGTVRIVDELKLEALKAKPKWVCGYSDITVLHAALNQKNVCSIHSTMPINFESNEPEALASFKDSLFGKLTHHNLPGFEKCRIGQATGKLIGGNLSVLYSILNSPTDYDYQDAILFIEDLDEHLYHIDRMLMNLKRSGVLGKINGLIVGGMTDMNDNAIPFGLSALQIVEEHMAEYDIPVCYGFPAGHFDNNHSIYIGAPCVLDIKQGGTKLSFQV